MTTIGVSEARAQLRTLLERVKRGEEIVLTQNGQPVAVLVNPKQLRVRRAGPTLDAATARRERLAAARRERPDRGAGLHRTRAEQLVADVREARDQR